MKLSVLMPTHNVGSRINANIINTTLKGRDGVEVIIRDNSGDEQKREFLSRIRLVNFNTFDEPSPLVRFQNFLDSDRFHSIFQYSPLRLNVVKSVWGFASTLPIYLSYTDWLMNCMFLMHGRLTSTNRFLYQYINANWSDIETCLKNDSHYFRMAGLDTSGVRLQWLIAVFEGAQIFARKYLGIQISAQQRQGLAGLWVRKWFHHFSVNTWARQAEGAAFNTEAVHMAKKWKDAKEIKLDELLLDIVDYYALSSPKIAQRYYDFWK